MKASNLTLAIKPMNKEIDGSTYEVRTLEDVKYVLNTCLECGVK